MEEGSRAGHVAACTRPPRGFPPHRAGLQPPCQEHISRLTFPGQRPGRVKGAQGVGGIRAVHTRHGSPITPTSPIPTSVPPAPVPCWCVRTRAPCAHLAGLCTRVSASAGAGEQFDFDLFTIGAGSGGVRGSRFASSYGVCVHACVRAFVRARACACVHVHVHVHVRVLAG
jgi:hypothetical protein